MAVVHSENYVSVKFRRTSAAAVRAEYADLAAVVGTGQARDGNATAQLRLLEIEGHLTTAHELFDAGRYQQAVEEYKAVQSLTYQLLHPTFPRGVGRRPGTVLPIRPDMLRPLLSASLGFVEAMTPKGIESDFGAAADVGDDVIAPLVGFDALGVNVVSDVPRRVRSDSELGGAYADRGQWTQARFFFERAQRGAEGLAGPAGTAARAAIDLSLGGVLVQLGRTDAAKDLLNRAAERFGKIADQVGVAQANLNLAAAFVKDGDRDSAAPLLRKADELITAAAGLPPTRPESLPADPGALAGPGMLAAGGSRVPPGSLRRAALDNRVGVLGGDALTRRIALTTTALGRAEHVLGGPAFVTATRSTSVNPGALGVAMDSQGLAVTFRLPEQGGGWTAQPVQTRAEAAERATVKELGVLVGDEVASIRWEPGATIAVEGVVGLIYAGRVAQTALRHVTGRWDLPSDLAVNLAHIYCYVLPVSLGDCYHALGDHEAAQRSYLAAAEYEFINPTLEAPALWQRIARNVLDHGDRFYRDDEFADALATYRVVLEPPGGMSPVDHGSPLYALAALKPVGDTVAAMLTALDVDNLDGPGNFNPALSAIVLEIRARLLQLDAGLDFLGMPATIVPIWSFDFLQNVARYFAQQAVQAEREYVSWTDRAENEALTRQQLAQTVTQAEAEQELAALQTDAAEAERDAFEAGVALADTRLENAAENRDAYAAMSWERVGLQRSMAWYSSQNPWERNNPIPGNGPDAGKEIHQVMAEKTERLQIITRDYELGAMDRQIEELAIARQAARSQRAAAHARVAAARQMQVVANLRRRAAADNLASFDNQVFTPDVWYQMGEFMRTISGSYLRMAITVARLMQRAYNFENDLARRFVRTDYSTNGVNGMLGADALLLDIDSFSYDLVTSVTRKRMPVKQTISLAERYPFQFETELRTTGAMSFETRVEDFDLAHPGTYQRRLERIEVEVDGVLPASGIRGVLTNGGISRDRTTNVNQITVRVQPRESLVLSEHRIRDDAFVFPVDPTRLAIFEGVGVAGTWTLELPRSANDLDYRAICDVRLVLYYQAGYDAGLAAAVQERNATFAGTTQHARNVPLRWAYPDAFFRFSDTGRLKFSVTPVDFPYSELDPQLTQVAVVLVPDPGVDPTAWSIRLGTPGHPETIAAPASADGSVTADNGHNWAPLVTGPATGDWVLELREDENPGLVRDGRLDLASIQNVVLAFEYTFTPRT